MPGGTVRGAGAGCPCTAAGPAGGSVVVSWAPAGPTSASSPHAKAPAANTIAYLIANLPLSPGQRSAGSVRGPSKLVRGGGSPRQDRPSGPPQPAAPLTVEGISGWGSAACWR